MELVPIEKLVCREDLELSKFPEVASSILRRGGVAESIAVGEDMKPVDEQGMRCVPRL